LRVAAASQRNRADNLTDHAPGEGSVRKKSFLGSGADWPAGATYLDLDRPADLRRLDDADPYLRSHG
jgi:hypothetical protein